MDTHDIRARKLRLSERFFVRLGKCPECGGKLRRETLPELAESWSYSMTKYTARLLGDRPAPKVHNVEVPKGWHCSSCGQWFLGAWAYWEG